MSGFNVPRGTRASSPWWAAVVFGLVAVLTARRKLPIGHGADGQPQEPTAAGGSRAKPTLTDGNGRTADKPSEIPARSWWDILKRVYAAIGDNRVLAVAAGVTFYGILAVFPAIVALVSLYGLFADASTIATQLDALKGILPGGALDIIGEQVKRITSKPGGSLGFGFAFGLGVALWSANAGMKAMFDALNVCYGEKEKRNFLVLNAMSLTFTVVAIVVLLLAMAAVVVMPVVLAYLPLGAAADVVLRLVRWPILLVLIGLGLAVLYRFAPSRKRPRWRWVTWGSAVATVGWVLASVLFSFYVSHFGSYNETYGSLGAAIGFMTWIWISTVVVLVGAEINAESEHQTAQDTTEDGRRPLGTRGATMADSVSG